MATPRVYRSLAQAWDEGYETFDHVADGHLMRKMVDGQWQIAIVITKPGAQLRELPDSAQFDFGAPFTKADIIDPDGEC